MKSIKAHLQQRKAGGGLLGAELAELTKVATSKKIPQPDEDLMAAVGAAPASSLLVHGLALVINVPDVC